MLSVTSLKLKVVVWELLLRRNITITFLLLVCEYAFCLPSGGEPTNAFFTRYREHSSRWLVRCLCNTAARLFSIFQKSLKTPVKIRIAEPQVGLAIPLHLVLAQKILNV